MMAAKARGHIALDGKMATMRGLMGNRNMDSPKRGFITTIVRNTDGDGRALSEVLINIATIKIIRKLDVKINETEQVKIEFLDGTEIYCFSSFKFIQEGLFLAGWAPDPGA